MKEQTIDEILDECERLYEPPKPPLPSKPLVAGKKLRAIPGNVMIPPLLRKQFGG